jgi:hypothetical protein
VATLTGRTVSATAPSCDTPSVVLAHSGVSDLLPPAELAAAAWRSITPSIAGTPHVRISRDGGRTYPARYARPLPAGPPGQPCTVPVYDPASGMGRMLALDLDPARGDVDRQAAELVQLLEHHGARVLADVSPSGGRHLFVLFAAPLPWRELRDVARAFAQRHPAVDPAPMSSLGGQISPPGARHKSGGWRLLSMPLAAATAAAGHPNGPEVWDALLTEFAAELQQIGTAGQADSSAELDGTGVPWVPRLGGRAPLAAELEHTARTGRWDRSRYAGRSEARMAVLSAAVARGWRLADVRSAVSSGAWRGLVALYERRSERGRLDRLLPLEWQRAIGFVAGEKNVRSRPTSDLQISRPPVPEPVLAAEYGLIRQWLTCVLVALEDPDRVRRWGGRVIAVRLVLLALGQAAMVSGSSVVEFGCRNLSLHSALSHRTVARVLELLRDEPDPLLDLVSRRSAARADRYQLRIPACYADSARWRRRHAGRVDAAHPAFLVLGGTAALAYQVLDSAEARGAEVARSARLSPSATSAALRILAEHGLAERGRHGWRRGPAVLDDIAESTGAVDIHQERAKRYQQDRASWRARLRQYAGARSALVAPGDGWLGLDDEDDWSAMLASRWPVLGGDFVRGPPGAARETA